MVGCGGGSSNTTTASTTPQFTQLVVFGDSLSDSGAYKAGGVADVDGGRFTVNSSNAKVWVENVATSLGFSNACPAEVGLPNVLGSIAFRSEAISDYPSCTNYAQGGARVSSIYGIDSFAIQSALRNLGQPDAYIQTVAPLGKMTTPVGAQMARHLSRNPNGYSGKELVVVLVGANDLFMNLSAIGAAAGGGQSAQAAAFFAGWESETLTLLGQAAGPTDRTNIAISAAITYMSNAATELLANVRGQLIDRGARNIAILNLPDVATSPEFLGDPSSAALASILLNAFNASLAAGSRNFPNVLFVDTFAQSQAQTLNPASYGLSNVSLMACGAGSNPFLSGSSLGCSAATINSGSGYEDIAHFLYADSVHPTPYGHQLLSNYFMTKLKESGLGR